MESMIKSKIVTSSQDQVVCALEKGLRVGSDIVNPEALRSSSRSSVRVLRFSRVYASVNRQLNKSCCVGTKHPGFPSFVLYR